MGTFGNGNFFCSGKFAFCNGSVRDWSTPRSGSRNEVEGWSDSGSAESPARSERSERRDTSIKIKNKGGAFLIGLN